MESAKASSSGNSVISENVDYSVNVNKSVIGLAKSTFTKPSQPPIAIDFEDIVYTVSLGFRKGRKEILHGIHGKFPAGQLIAIMGPSGAGKTKLLDVLSGYKISGVSGNVHTNGVPRNLNLFRKSSCYIPQENKLQLLLTTEENMQIAADLKQPSRVSKYEKSATINEILRMLGLEHTTSTMTAKLSGGEKKRLSIALELVTNPTVMFLDEPTTGLDSSSCFQCVKLLKHLSQQGRTIVCTLHQPSASLFDLFDLVYVLGDGNCLYQGATDKLVQFLADVDCPCPCYHNPADYIIELACGEHGSDKIDAMVNMTGNGKALKYFNNFSKIVTPETHFLDFEETSPLKQLTILLRRGYIISKRDKTLTFLRLGTNVVIGLMLGVTFWQSGDDGAKVLENYKLLFCLIAYHIWSTITLTTSTFPSELSILTKEHFNRWYSLKMYYVSIVLIEIPVTITCCGILCTIIYYMTGQPLETNRFFMFFLINLLISFVAQSSGLMFGATFNATNGLFVGGTTAIPLLMYAGFAILLRDLPSYLYWGVYISYPRYAFEGLMGAIYGYNRSTISCPEEAYCYFKYPQKFLEVIDVPGDQYGKGVVALIINLVLFKVLGYVLLRYKLRSVR